MFINNETLKLAYQIESSEDGLKVIDVLASSMNISSRLIRKCKNHKQIYLNGTWGSVNRLVHEGDVISLVLDHDENTFEPNAIPVDIIYEDGDMMAVNKQPFLVVHPTKGHPVGTLANALSNYQKTRCENYKIRFINRLDRDTSGVVLIAKNAFAQQVISEQMKLNLVKKTYFAVVDGVVTQDAGTIDLPIDRANEGDIKRTVLSSGLESITHFQVIERYSKHTLVKINLETGRTHQIRVHFAHIGHPVHGDSLYGTTSVYIDRQALHCAEMIFSAPRTKNEICASAELPADLLKLIHMLTH
ncbi:RluA family pseudouridine synthase [Fusibacter tunisiensis]|uniref:Pseudouridine synthase n=1 Tax=Fusibacter tunisiensis TaxID=1008308 RepID=A0ABS2MSR7_9FIRM|nr:RluA family pseudouridine synthase [Fusibacter tunisiensis]MBM7562390.1 23S rRNA pseudouridine1911/1915/1917 synthase [Fusibacter tunisiensis]